MKKQLNLFLKEKEKWQASIDSASARDSNFNTLSNEPLEVCYFPKNSSEEYVEKNGFPGQFPYTRGIHSNLYRGKLWTMRQFAGFGKPEDTNNRFKKFRP